MDNLRLTSEWFIAIRRKLVRFFATARCPDAQSCADETLFRLTKALSNGKAIDVNPDAFVYGIARRVEQECRRRRNRRKEVQFDETAADPPATDNSNVEELHLRLEKCLQGLSPFERALIIKYYEGTEQGEDKRNRKALAERLQMSPVRLVKETMKIRQKLERCLSASVDDN